MSARENARLAAQARLPRRWQPCGGGGVFNEASRRGDQALERLGLTGIANRPAGLLSHGDQRLLEVAMALAQQPRGCWTSRPRACRCRKPSRRWKPWPACWPTGN
jgi:branched-chain amino acid transport system ATP-binding protein